jgi:hypothetical protein
VNEKEKKQHILSVSESATMPRYMIFVDTETTQEQSGESTIYQNLRLGVAIAWQYRSGRKNDKREIIRFKDAEVFWQWVQRYCIEGAVLYIMAHNAVFDMTVLQHITWLSKMGYKCQFVFDNAMTFIANWVLDGHSIYVLNTANWFQGSVDRWGQELGLAKLEMPDVTASDDEWFVYCERDTEILQELVKWYIRFLTENDLGSWKYTIASQAFTAYRHRFMAHRITIPANDEESQIARQSYKGGRTEVFRVGRFMDGPYFKIDVNSMYPYVMANHQYPVKLHSLGKDLTHKQALYLKGKYGIIADCTVCTPIPYFAETSTGRNVYPVGTFRTTLTTNEFYLALDNRWICEVHSFALYSMRPIFRDYVRFFYALKVKCTEQGNRLQRAFTKLYLNSLYGKFGQRGYIDEVIGEVAIPGLAVWYGIDAEEGTHYLYRQVGHTLMRSTQKGESYNAFCAIASHVTANARLVLYNAVLKAGREHCFYSDTDSIILDATGYMRLADDLDDTRLGAWALEGKSDFIEVVAPKHYLFDGKWTMKGVRKTAEKLEDGAYRQEQWPGFSTILKSGREQYFNTLTTKRLSPEIRTGKVMPDGTVVPLVLGNERMSMQWYNL